MIDNDLILYQDTYLRDKNIDLIAKKHETSMSTSFEGFHKTFSKKVFVKFITIPWDESESIEYEVQALIKFREKKNIVNVYDAFYDAATNSQLVIVMEFIEGPSLNKICGLDHISIKQALQITGNILYGLNEFHCQKLVHRDLKLENIILESENPVIVDLGSVKQENAVVNKDDPIPNLYRSPEVFHKSIYSVRSDLYQVGLVLFQLINGTLPFETEFYAKMSKKPFTEETKKDIAINEIKKLVTRNKLTNVIKNDLLFCPKLKKLVDKALTLKYPSVDSFYKDIYKVINEVPDWKRESENCYVCKEWLKSDYMLIIEENYFRIFKLGTLRKRDLGVFKSSDDVIMYFQRIIA